MLPLHVNIYTNLISLSAVALITAVCLSNTETETLFGTRVRQHATAMQYYNKTGATWAPIEMLSANGAAPQKARKHGLHTNTCTYIYTHICEHKTQVRLKARTQPHQFQRKCICIGMHVCVCVCLICKCIFYQLLILIAARRFHTSRAPAIKTHETAALQSATLALTPTTFTGYLDICCDERGLSHAAAAHMCACVCALGFQVVFNKLKLLVALLSPLVAVHQRLTRIVAYCSCCLSPLAAVPLNCLL